MMLLTGFLCLIVGMGIGALLVLQDKADIEHRFHRYQMDAQRDQEQQRLKIKTLEQFISALLKTNKK